MTKSINQVPDPTLGSRILKL